MLDFDLIPVLVKLKSRMLRILENYQLWDPSKKEGVGQNRNKINIHTIDLGCKRFYSNHYESVHAMCRVHYV